MSIYVKDSGTWQRVKAVYKNVSGTWTHIDNSISVNDSGTWRQVHTTGQQEWTTDQSTTFTVPDGIYFMKLYGAGAGGGAGGSYYSTAGQGGGGGGYADGIEVECTPGSTISITVGNGGSGVKFGDTFCPCNGYAGGDTTIAGLTVTGNVTASTITLSGGGGGTGANQGSAASNGGSTSGITGGTSGQQGQGIGSAGRGGKSLGGAFDGNGYGTDQAFNPSRACWGVNGDTSGYAQGKGTGGCGVPDGSSCGEGAFGGGGNGADGYVKFEWNYDYS